MKKILSILLSTVLAVFSNLWTAFAGGIDKTEILSDGTQLIYVSTENIRKVFLEYLKKSKEIKEQRYSVTKDWIIKGASITAAACGCYLSAQAGSEQSSDNNSYLVLSGQIDSCVLGFIGFMFPDYHEHKLIQQHGSELSLSGKWENQKRYIFKWGPEYTNQGVDNILTGLFKFLDKDTRDKLLSEDSTLCPEEQEEIDSGACIVIRPESLRNKEDAINSRCFHTGVYPQSDMNEPKEPNGRRTHGYRWALEHSLIPSGW